MAIPLQITFRGMESSPAVEARIREKVATLERFHPHVMSCRAVVESPHRHHQKGRLFSVHLELKVPRGEVVVSRDSSEHHAHEDIYVAIRDAFDEATRQLEDHARKLRQEVKVHVETPRGRVIQISYPEDFGFIRTIEGREVYFHRESVIDGDFDRIAVGDEVRFVLHEAEGESGPHASSVRVFERRRHPIMHEPSETDRR